MNRHGIQARGGQVAVDASLNGGPGAFFEVVANSAQSASVNFVGTHGVGERIPVQFRAGTAFVQIDDLGASEVVVLVKRP